MTFQLMQTRLLEVIQHRTARHLFVGLAFALSLFAVRLADAQVTTELLIGDSVSDVGTKYSDVDEAVKRFSNRDVLGARQFLESAARKHPNLPPVELMMAKMYFVSGNPAGAQMALEQTVLENPTDPEPYILLGDQAIAQGRTVDAEALYEKGLRLIADFQGNAKRKHNLVIKAHNGHALVAERRKNWEPAVADLQILLKEDPDNAAAHFRLGRALFMLKKQREGYDELVKAQKLDDSLPHPQVSSALLYDQLGQRDEAAKSFESAVRADKTNLKTLIAYAQWLIQTGDPAKAELVLAQSRKIDPESVDALSLSGVAARMSKKMKPAEDYFVEALRLGPSNSGVINQLALLLVDQPDDAKRKRALDFAQINATLRPDSSEANITLSWVLYKLGRTRDANELFKKGVQMGGLTADSSYLVAQMLVDQNQKDVARQILERALDNSEGTLFIMRADAETLKDSLSG
jgi:tetratricopeptide (TPR) repeat protein